MCVWCCLRQVTLFASSAGLEAVPGLGPIPIPAGKGAQTRDPIPDPALEGLDTSFPALLCMSVSVTATLSLATFPTLVLSVYKTTQLFENESGAD